MYSVNSRRQSVACSKVHRLCPVLSRKHCPMHQLVREIAVRYKLQSKIAFRTDLWSRILKIVGIQESP